ncbi:NAC domain protein [Rhynchospora pubera]|uniref:NAC domain protein n=1 Tax=Rhynchospora pubera TaxID=906938 RepID=A0AAV8HSS2_9POAL|nr:NAC domain protein [Rhynchospora pubera]
MDFGNWLHEEQYISYLAIRRKDDPIPSGVFVENPFRLNPWDHEDSWYLFEESTNEGHREGDVRRTENGFWKWSSIVTIPVESAIGFKNVFEFYQGNPPAGTRTGWMMHQYRARLKFEGPSHLQENISLCRLFWHNDERVKTS